MHEEANDEMHAFMEFARTTAIYPGAETGNMVELLYLALGLAGKAGEVATKVEKLYRDAGTLGDKEYTEMEGKILSELGNVLWYWVRLVDTLGGTPHHIIDATVFKLASRKSRGTLGGSGDSR